MTAFNYGRSKASADRMIARYGQPAVLRSPSRASGPKYNPTMGAPVDRDVVIVVMDFSDYEVTNSGGRVLKSDKRVLMARGSLAVDPTPAMTLFIGGVEHRIVGPDVGKGIKTVAPGGTVILYELQARL